MQRAKDTFYAALRDEVSALNPGRTMVVRGVRRPGVLVEENELPMAVALPDVFRLRWTGVAMDATSTVPLVKLRCEVVYETAGSEASGGLDRGRLLSAMDAELSAALGGETQSTVKMDLSGATPVAEGTRIFWSDPGFGAVELRGERIGRTVTVDVWSVEEEENEP